MKVAIAILFIVITLVLGSSHTALPLSDFCSKRCRERCSKAASEERCFKYCGICCEDCKCVPSGTYGNKQECPCYRDKKNSKGNPKCP